MEIEDEVMISIMPLTEAHESGEAQCSLSIGKFERTVVISDVRDTAEDLLTCAAYGEMIGQFMKVGLSHPHITSLLRDCMKDRERKYFGRPTTFNITPAASENGEGAVVIQRGSAEFGIECSAARAIAKNFYEAAEGAETDVILKETLNSLRLDAETISNVFAYLVKLRNKR